MYRIKKHTNHNHYLHVGEDLWVRNPGIYGVSYLDLNNLTSKSDYPVILKNEIFSNRMKYPWIDTADIKCDQAVIVSDGFDFAENHQHIGNLPAAVKIFAVNGALAKWTHRRQPDYYVVNNPYKEALRYLPKTNLTRCIASVRTSYEFMQKYPGVKYRYYPTCDTHYNGTNSKECVYRIDDYRNPVCAAINLLHRFGVKKLLLAFCDEVFDNERPGSIKGDNGKSYYPQHLQANALIDGNLYWLSKNNGCDIRQNTAGPKLKTATYIPMEDIAKFFKAK